MNMPDWKSILRNYKEFVCPCMWHLILEHCLAVESFNIRGMTTNNGGTVYCFEDRHQKPQFLSHAHVGLTENRVMLILIVYHHLPFKHSHNWRIPHFQVPNPCRNIFLHLHIARGICRNRTAVVECFSANRICARFHTHPVDMSIFRYLWSFIHDHLSWFSIYLWQFIVIYMEPWTNNMHPVLIIKFQRQVTSRRQW